MKHGALLFSVFVSLLGACSDNKPSGSSGCSVNKDCDPGQVCVDEICRELCSVDGGCEAAEICVAGACTEGERKDPPNIFDIDSNGTADSATDHAGNHLHTELLVTGENLEGASVRLVGTRTFELSVSSTTNELITAALPADLVADTYSLQVSNSVDTDQVDVSILQGETGPSGPAGPLPVVQTGGGLVGTGDTGTPLAIDTEFSFVSNRASAPSSPELGRVYWDTTTAELKAWNGTEWHVITSTPGCAKSPEDALQDCEAVMTTCSTTESGIYWITGQGGGAAFPIHCEMTYDEGGWTLVGSISSRDGIAANNCNLSWNYDNARWSDASTLRPDTFDDGHDHKYASWSNLGFNKIMIIETVNGVEGWKSWEVGPKTTLMDLFGTSCTTLATTPVDSGGAITKNNAVIYADNLLLNCSCDYELTDDLCRLHGNTPANPDGNAHYNGGWGFGVDGDSSNCAYQSEARPQYGGWSDQVYPRAAFYSGGKVWQTAVTAWDAGTFFGRIYIK